MNDLKNITNDIQNSIKYIKQQYININTTCRLLITETLHLESKFTELKKLTLDKKTEPETIIEDSQNNNIIFQSSHKTIGSPLTSSQKKRK